MKIQYHLEYAGVSFLITLARSVSRKTAAWLGGRLGDVAFDIVRWRRALTIRHLAQAMPETNSVRAARSVYRHLGRTAVEHARLLGSSVTDISDRIAVSGNEHLAQALNKGNGVVLVTGHFGYWELLGAAVASLGLPIAVVAKDQHNPAVNKLMIHCREGLGMRVIPMASATHAVIKCLKRNECVGLLTDQDAGPGGTFVRFMGRPASTYQGPALFALRTGAPIVPCFIIREATERHRVVFEAPIAAVPTGDEEADIYRYTQAYTDVLERYIRIYPDHWFWVQRRWKTRAPDSAPEHVAET